MFISEIYIYPVKSLAGISLNAAHLQKSGFEYDRQWMVVNKHGNMMTQREYPQMALIETAIEQNQLTLSTFGMDNHTVEPIAAHGDSIETQVWGDKLMGISHNHETNAWLSHAIGTECKLIGFPEDQTRQCDREHSLSGDHTLYADAYPVLVVSQSSLDFLNAKLSQPIAINRFRPNLVIEECGAHAEDSWNVIYINSIKLRNGVPCARCSVPNVDPESGILAGPEPMHTLSSYRQKNGEIYFGMTFIPEHTGRISVGDQVLI